MITPRWSLVEEAQDKLTKTSWTELPGFYQALTKNLDRNWPFSTLDVERCFVKSSPRKNKFAGTTSN